MLVIRNNMNVELPMCLLDWIGSTHIKWEKEYLSLNRSEGAAMQLLEKNPNKIKTWYGLSRNPSESAIQLLEQNQDKIDWYNLSKNPSKRAMRLLEKNPNKMDWYNLSKNPSEGAMLLLEKNPDKINWDW